MLTSMQSGKLPGLTLKAWAYFSGATGAISKANGVTSVTRNSVGNYTVNLTAAMSSTNYSIATDAQWQVTRDLSTTQVRSGATSTTAVALESLVSGASADVPMCLVGVYE